MSPNQAVLIRGAAVDREVVLGRQGLVEGVSVGRGVDRQAGWTQGRGVDLLADQTQGLAVAAEASLLTGKVVFGAVPDYTTANFALYSLSARQSARFAIYTIERNSVTKREVRN